jgi:hypothetical protein
LYTGIFNEPFNDVKRNDKKRSSSPQIYFLISCYPAIEWEIPEKNHRQGFFFGQTIGKPAGLNLRQKSTAEQAGDNMPNMKMQVQRKKHYLNQFMQLRNNYRNVTF